MRNGIRRATEHTRPQPCPALRPKHAQDLTAPAFPVVVYSGKSPSTDLDAQLHSYLAQSLAPGTQSNLRTGLSHFRRFRELYGARAHLSIPRWGGDLQTEIQNENVFMRFAVYLLSLNRGARSGIQASTALNYCSLVRNHLAAIAGVSLNSKSPRWKRLARALKKQHTRERKECRAFRMSHLRKAFSGLGPSRDVAMINRWAALSCGVCLLARPKELASLRRSDLTFEQHPSPHAVIKLKPLKKGPEQQPVPILIASGDRSGADAYFALRRLAEIDPVPLHLASSTPLFRSNGRALSVPVITGWVQAAVRAAGEPGDLKLYTARSLRVGGATEAHAVGANELTIALLGRWASDCARLYARASQGQALHLSRRMGGAPEDPSLELVFSDYVQTARR